MFYKKEKYQTYLVSKRKVGAFPLSGTVYLPFSETYGFCKQVYAQKGLCSPFIILETLNYAQSVA